MCLSCVGYLQYTIIDCVLEIQHWIICDRVVEKRRVTLYLFWTPHVHAYTKSIILRNGENVILVVTLLILCHCTKR